MAARGRTEPRIYTPPLRELTPETSLGFLAVEFARDVMGHELYPWQEWWLIHALEIVDEPDDPDFPLGWRFRFRVVLTFVARQNGKTEISKILVEFFALVLHVAMIVGTSLSLDKAQEVFDGVAADLEDDPELSAQMLGKPKRSNGAYRMRFATGGAYKVAAMGRKAGRGDSVDLGLLDELREHRNFDTWDAMLNATNAKPNGLLVCFSNAGTVDSVVLRQLRSKVLASLGIAEDGFDTGEDDNADVEDIAIFEWSAPPGADKEDEAALAQSNPALGYGRVTMRALKTSARTSEEIKYRTEVLCQIVNARIDPPFDEGAWAGGTDESSRFDDSCEVCLGIDVSADRRRTAVAGAGTRPDGLFHAEVLAYRTGISWVLTWLRRYVAKYGDVRVAVQSRGAPASSLVGEVNEIEGVELVEWQGPLVASWTGRFFDAVNASGPESESDAVPLMHFPQPALDEAASIASVKSLGDATKVFNRKDSPKDISTLVACTAAFGLLTETDLGGPKVYESAYAGRDTCLVTI